MCDFACKKDCPCAGKANQKLYYYKNISEALRVKSEIELLEDENLAVRIAETALAYRNRPYEDFAEAIEPFITAHRTAAEAKARNNALEEAANALTKVQGYHAFQHGNDAAQIAQGGAMIIRGHAQDAIRALKTNGGQG